MNRRLIPAPLGAAAVIVFGGICLSACESKHVEGPKPSGSVAQTLAKAGRDHKLALVVFGAEWCGPCHDLQDNLGDIRLQPALSKMVYTHLDIDDEGSKAELAKYYKAKSIPYILVLKSDGSHVAEQEGWGDAGQFADFLNEALASAKN